MASSGGSARWPHVALSDLSDPSRRLTLARVIVARGFLPRAVSSLFLVFAAAEHALARGTNPPALFSATLRRPELITEAEDELGRQRAQQALGRASGPPRHHGGLARLGELLPEKWLA